MAADTNMVTKDVCYKPRVAKAPDDLSLWSAVTEFEFEKPTLEASPLSVEYFSACRGGRKLNRVLNTDHNNIRSLQTTTPIHFQSKLRAPNECPTLLAMSNPLAELISKPGPETHADGTQSSSLSLVLELMKKVHRAHLQAIAQALKLMKKLHCCMGVVSANGRAHFQAYRP